MNNCIFIYGVPGSGKTHYSEILGKQLNLSVIEGDTIRDRAKIGTSKSEYPFVFLGTCKAWKQFGELTKENAIKGLLAVRTALQEAVQNEIAGKDHFILESAFLDPQLLARSGRMILLTTKDEARHKRQFLHHREKMFDLKGDEFKAARMIQEYLIEEARKLGVEVIENKTN